MRVAAAAQRHRRCLPAAASAALLMALAAGPLAAEPVPVDKQANHPNGSGLVVRAIELGDDTTRVDVTATTAGEDVYLNWNGSMKLVDDQGASYRVVPPPDNVNLQVPVNSRLTGELIFAGRINPAAKRVLLSTNEGVGGSASSASTDSPIFRIEIPLPAAGPGAVTVPSGSPTDRPVKVEPDGTSAAGAAVPAPGDSGAAPPTTPAPAGPRQVCVDRQANHPNGAILIVDSIEVGEDGVLATLRLSTSDEEVELNRSNSLVLTDDRGNRYRAVPPADNPRFALPAHSRVEARVFFAGRLNPAATRLTLSTNEGVGGSADNRFSNNPIFRVAIPLEG